MQLFFHSSFFFSLATHFCGFCLAQQLQISYNVLTFPFKLRIFPLVCTCSNHVYAIYLMTLHRGRQNIEIYRRNIVRDFFLPLLPPIYYFDWDWDWYWDLNEWGKTLILISHSFASFDYDSLQLVFFFCHFALKNSHPK